MDRDPGCGPRPGATHVSGAPRRDEGRRRAGGLEFQADLGYRAWQPVWRFRVHTAQGAAFEAYVRVVADAYLSDLQP